MTVLKKDQRLMLAVEDIDPDGGVLNRRRLEQDEESPLLSDGDDERAGALKSDAWADMPWYKRPSIYWLLIPFAFSALAFGGVLVPKVNLVLSLVCNRYLNEHSATPVPFVLGGSPDDRCRVPAVQSRVATFKLCMSIISGALAAIVSPKIGSMSDRYGRTRMLAYVNSGQIIQEAITILAARFPNQVSYYWILVGAAFDGLGGSFISSMAVSHSYAADCTPSSKRNVVFGYFHGFLFTGIAFGPILAGYIIRITGDIISMFYISSCCHIFFFLMLLFVIPDSVSKSRQRLARKKHDQKTLASVHTHWTGKLLSFNLLEPLKILYGPNASPGVRRNLMLLAATDTIVFGVGMGAAVVILLYSNYTFGWDQWEQAKFTSIVNSCRVTYLLVFLPVITHYYRKYQARTATRPESPSPHHAIEGTDSFELAVIRFAIFADSLGFLSYALSSTGTQFILSGAITSIGGVASPTMQAALTKHVPKESIGQLLGAMGLLHSLARVVGPTLFTGIYASTIAFFPQAYFLILAAMFGLGFAVSWLIRPGVRLEQSSSAIGLTGDDSQSDRYTDVND